ncbi:MAG TPA: SGNH/GDSL hydrolase family protein [Thermoanaerobaculia bacterium]|nr:SGNH/GDSL hydrolase family protein [Thermoanaerobaculia bacterium]
MDATGAASRPADAPRYLALGDSYTIGEAVAAAGRWPVQLAVLLRRAGVAVGEPEIVARTGWTTAELSAGIDAAAPHGPFALVSLLIGVNDQYRGGQPASYRAAFTAMLRRAIAFAGGEPGRVIVLSIPDWSVTPFAAGSGRELPRIAREIRDFNAVNREETGHAGARYVDVTPASERALGDPSLLAADGLHPSAAMYAEWARLALPAARAALVSRVSMTRDHLRRPARSITRSSR